MSSRLTNVGISFALMASISGGIGCSDDSESTSKARATTTTGDRAAIDRSTNRERITTGETERREGNQSNQDDVREGGSRTTTLPSGAVVVTPPLPTRSKAEAQPGCRVVHDDNGSKVVLPPTPGVRAQRTEDGSVLATVTYRRFSKRCRPVQLRLTLDVNDDALPGISRTYRFRTKKHQRVRLTIPRYFEGTPDVVAASAVDRRGIGGDSVKVLITEP
jgi:hypothetical protein